MSAYRATLWAVQLGAPTRAELTQTPSLQNQGYGKAQQNQLTVLLQCLAFRCDSLV